MAEISEPPAKKIKTETMDSFINNIVYSKHNLQAVYSDDLDMAIPTVEVYAGTVKNQKELSTTLKILNEKLPLQDLGHLKRIAKNSIILCQTNDLIISNQESIQAYIEQHVPELNDVFQFFKVVTVPATAPKTKKQNLESNRRWPCNFHPNKLWEKLVSDCYFKPEQLIIHRTQMGLVFEVAKWYLSKSNSIMTTDELKLSEVNIAVVVDPIIQSVVTVAIDSRQKHPVQHAVMVAIDNVAKTQNGGSWNTEATEETLSGIDKKLVLYLKDKYSTSFGARPAYKKDNPESKLDSPYLCTGYDIYLLREPCIMCAMALVHARMKNIFFTFDNMNLGAIKSKTKLQCLKSLNHHYDVFTGFLT